MITIQYLIQQLDSRVALRGFGNGGACVRALVLFFLIILVMASLGCTTASRSGQAATVESLTLDQDGITDRQLTHSLGRFADNYLEGLSQHVNVYMGGETTIAERREVLRWYVAVMTVAWNIANGPDPELNLLDMITQMTLTRMEVEASNFPELAGDRGREIRRVTREAEEEIWQFSGRVLTSQQQQTIRDLISAWRD